MAGLYEGQSLSDICYEHIKDTFYHGLFGDFKLVIDNGDPHAKGVRLSFHGPKDHESLQGTLTQQSCAMMVDNGFAIGAVSKNLRIWSNTTRKAAAQI